MSPVEHIIQLIQELSQDEKRLLTLYLAQTLEDPEIHVNLKCDSKKEDRWEKTGITVPAETVFE